MSRRRSSARAVLLAVMVASALAVVAPAARAGGPADICDVFPHRQTYTEEGLFQGPSWHYDRTVTILYTAESCTADFEDTGNYLLSVSGEATIHEGKNLDGAELDKRPFTSLIDAKGKEGKPGWPIRWWSCFDGEFNYIWSIPGVYTFGVTARDGDWTMFQSEAPGGASATTSVEGCRKK